MLSIGERIFCTLWIGSVIMSCLMLINYFISFEFMVAIGFGIVIAQPIIKRIEQNELGGDEKDGGL